jgi:hypothetical protein
MMDIIELGAVCRYLTLCDVILVQQSSENKMSIQSIGIVLHPTTGIAQPVLNVLLNNISTLFGETQLTRLVCYSVVCYGMVFIVLQNKKAQKKLI